jgi:hypothetical protein
MKMIAHSFPISKAQQGLQGKGQHTGARIVGHLKDVFEGFVLPDCRLIVITTDNVSSNYSLTREIPTTIEASGIELLGMGIHISCMVHVIQLALG